ncbi:MAG: bL17 family ribosomal protein, partial [Ignavibacteria bacterium]|nr:bL17 family ribosomal protein [Ignavibacteria bacterium]
YTRIVKLGRRQGDGAELAVIELVDFNTGKEEAEKPAAPKKEKKARAPKKAAKVKGGSPEPTPPQEADQESESHSDEKESR